MNDRDDDEPQENVFVMKPPPTSKTIDYAGKLNDQQYQAVMHEKGNALVIAGAGSGKTRVLTYRVTRLIEAGLPPQAIMLVTFTKKAAEEMTGRVQKIVDFPRGKLLSGTFHSVANRFLRKHAKLVGFEHNFTILDQGDAEQLMRRILGEVTGKKDPEDKKRYPRPSNLVDMYSRANNLHLQLKEILAGFFPQFIDLEADIGHMLARYVEAKKKNNLMDFDDLLIYFLRLLRTEPSNERIFKQVRHLLVDEYQDVNQLQADIVIELARRADSSMVVGDDAQSIYSFRGASVRHMLDFEVLLPDVKKYFLTENYRSTPQILNLANSSIKHNKKQFKKELKTRAKGGGMPQVVPCMDDDEESNFICQKVLEAAKGGTPFHEQAVLFRAAFQSLILEKALLTYKIPYAKRAGLRFYETAHVKDVLAFGLVVQNPRNEIAWSRILGLYPGMGPASVERVVAALLESTNPLEGFSTANLKVELKGKRVQADSIARLASLQAFYKGVAIDGKTGTAIPAEKLPKPDTFFDAVLKTYEPLLKDKYENADDRLLELREFVNIAGKYPTLHELLEEIAISETFVGETTRQAGKAKDEKPLVLSTIHQAKGLEWDAVYVIGAAETLLPHALSMDHPDEIEEERRLFYVASTRARKELYFTYAQSRWSFNKTTIMRRSSFLDEIERDEVFQVLKLYYGMGTTRFEDLV
ncbi:MAG: ATP-dependent helicase [Candidatus Lokiarchaeota archaeon]|nr:ATP-dependent helicase [Candidatus Lokiarchaeota archaeon]